ncbi:phage holin family protein [Lawsonibacter sp. NSJ-52]|uniref:Phage holin family protein n=1 Tax=Lawsonibacter faecis TaxID=2763052 RepID=A0A8J6M8W6_9FIRM|nr:phage holin family protein [Lawsonibacter faecis]
MVAGVFKRSPKSEGGALESRAGFKGLLRKGGILMLVLASVWLDKLLGPPTCGRRCACSSLPTRP